MKGIPNYLLQFLSFPEYKKLQDFYMVIIDIIIKDVLLYDKENCIYKTIQILKIISIFLEKIHYILFLCYLYYV